MPSAFDVQHSRRLVDAFLLEFYASAKASPKYSILLDTFSPAAWADLELAENKHFAHLLSPEIHECLWHKEAEKLAHKRFSLHLPAAWISDSSQSLNRKLIQSIHKLDVPSASQESLLLTLTARLLHDTSIQSSAYAERAASTSQTLELPIQLDHLLLTVPSIAALYSRLTEFLLRIPGIAGAWLGSCDPQGVMRAYFSAGEGVQVYVAGEPFPLMEYPDNPITRAWTTGQPHFLGDWEGEGKKLRNSYWQQRGMEYGWRSSCSIPFEAAGKQRDILTLYSKRIHFFVQPDISLLILHLHALLGAALERLRLTENLEHKKQTLSLYKAAMDASANGILISGPVAENFAICYANPAFERITGYSESEALGRNCRFLQGSDRAQPQLETLRTALQNGSPCAVELRNYRKDGTLFWNAFSIAPVRDDAGQITHFIGIQNDITLQKSAIAIHARTNALYGALMGAAELIVQAHTERELLDGLCRMLVESELFSHVWIGKPNMAGDIEALSVFSSLEDSEYWYRPNVHTDDEKLMLIVRAWRRSAMQYSNDRLTDPECPLIHDFHRKHGLHATAVVPLQRDGELWALLTLVSKEANIFSPELLELLESIGRLVGHGLDSLDLRHILEDERQHQAWLARHDPLTDILNRRGLMERLDESTARARRHNRLLAVAVMDIDGFKAINDLHGHPAGDLLLQTIAERLESAIRQTDAAGRLGGDEFVLVLEDLDQDDDLNITLARILESVELPIHLANGRTTSVRGSIGVTLFPNDDSDPERLLRHADRALYALKEAKPDPEQRWMLFQAEADEKMLVRQKSILTLFRSGMLRVHYQPVINLQTGKVTGVEALARLIDQDNTLLYPADFLHQFGISELIALTQQVLEQSIQDIKQAEKSGFSLHVGINLEPSMMTDRKAMDALRQQIESTGIDPRRVILELLEHADILSMADAQQTLRDLRSCGVRIALDDVGSAYSSLLRVKELPVDLIKLDRSFLIGLEQHPKELRFLMNLVNMLQSLGLDLVVEGIESGASLDAMSALGAKHGQGFYIARPMDFESLMLWLARHRAAPWTHPTSVLGVVALQLHGLDAASRILPQRPTYLDYMQNCDPARECVIGVHMQRLGAVAARAIKAHNDWHAKIASLCSGSNGIIHPADFETHRLLYENELFLAALQNNTPLGQ